jgi:hypothetical protein
VLALDRLGIPEEDWNSMPGSVRSEGGPITPAGAILLDATTKKGIWNGGVTPNHGDSSQRKISNKIKRSLHQYVAKGIR